MKTVVLMPVKNEEWILPTTLKAAESIADLIIVGDQLSTDKTREILASSEKVVVIDNLEVGHSNKIRWKMLDYLREHHGANNLVINIDADEILPPYLFNKHKSLLLENIQPGTIISSPWVQVWRSIHTYRSDNSVWSPLTNKKPFIFLDNGVMDYDRNFVINDHTSRVPNKNCGETVEIRIPLLHLQFANWNRTQIKQAWYQCCELINGKLVENINNSYSITRNEHGIGYEVVPELWYQGVEISTSIESCDVTKTWYYREIVDMFDKHGIEKFESLHIWHINELKVLRKNHA